MLPCRDNFISESEYKLAQFEHGCGWNDAKYGYEVQKGGCTKWYDIGRNDYYNGIPKVHNKRHNTAPVDAVYVGRGSPYGNPFMVGKDGTRDEVCEKFANMLEHKPELKASVIQNLKGKHLVCHCKPKRCHADTLLEVANCGI
jgi:hypothetical protein